MVLLMKNTCMNKNSTVNKISTLSLIYVVVGKLVKEYNYFVNSFSLKNPLLISVF